MALESVNKSRRRKSRAAEAVEASKSYAGVPAQSRGGDAEASSSTPKRETIRPPSTQSKSPQQTLEQDIAISEELLKGVLETEEEEELSEILIVNLHNKGITDAKGIGECIKARSVDLSFNKLKGVGGLERNACLRELKLYSNKIESLVGFARLGNLKVLELQDNRIKSLAGIEVIRQLECLRLDSNELTSLKGIEHLESLQELSVSRNRIESLEGALSSMKQLRELHASNNMLKSVRGVESCSKLEELAVSNNRIANLKSLSRLKKLDVLFVDGNCLPELCEFPDKLTISELYAGNNGVTTIKGLGSKCPNLEIFFAEKNEIRSLEEVQHELGCLRELSEVNLKGNSICEEQAYQRTMRSLKKIHVLDEVVIEGDPSNSAPTTMKSAVSSDGDSLSNKTDRISCPSFKDSVKTPMMYTRPKSARSGGLKAPIKPKEMDTIADNFFIEFDSYSKSIKSVLSSLRRDLSLPRSEAAKNAREANIRSASDNIPAHPVVPDTGIGQTPHLSKASPKKNGGHEDEEKDGHWALEATEDNNLDDRIKTSRNALAMYEKLFQGDKSPSRSSANGYEDGRGREDSSSSSPASESEDIIMNRENYIHGDSKSNSIRVVRPSSVSASSPSSLSGGEPVEINIDKPLAFQNTLRPVSLSHSLKGSTPQKTLKKFRTQKKASSK